MAVQEEETTIKRMGILLIAMLWLILCTSGCQPVTGPTVEEAETVLRTFLMDLHDGRYDEAALRYAPDDDPLVFMNPDIDASETAALLTRGCMQNGFMCMLPGEVVSVEEGPGQVFTFTMQFLLDDGTRFEQGPCCGEESDDPPITDFQLRVVCEGNTCRVMDLPPYVP